jgi:hypothetical protein
MGVAPMILTRTRKEAILRIFRIRRALEPARIEELDDPEKLRQVDLIVAILVRGVVCWDLAFAFAFAFPRYGVVLRNALVFEARLRSSYRRQDSSTAAKTSALRSATAQRGKKLVFKA